MSSDESIKVLGIMSGTSLDGLDMALCKFALVEGQWKYDILDCTTLDYEKSWKIRLSDARGLSGSDLSLLDIEYGDYIGSNARLFLNETGTDADLIASHGHTVFHQPENKFTLQIGNGAEIAAKSGVPVVCDFRKKDVALGGQGAPLVPVGDELLFGEYDYCLNLGGFANISYEQSGLRKAFDICPVNTVLNEMAVKRDLEFDHGGDLGRKGNLDNRLLDRLNGLEYYKKDPPKSLGREWLDNSFLPCLANELADSGNDVMRTVYEHIAQQVGRIPDRGKTVLITGGGVYNDFLLERIRFNTSGKFISPDNHLVNYKEAMIFGLLGALRWQGKINCYASVTGARVDSCSGSVYL